jgi:mediator of RNA polymerase II transcription subunit 16
MAWIVDSLFEFPNTLPSSMDLADPTTYSLSDLLTQLHSKNTISLHLLLTSSTRGFLTAICRRLAHIDYIARKAMMQSSQAQSNTQANTPANQQSAQGLSPALRSAYEQIALLTSAPMLKISTFETLLSSLTAQVKEAYPSTDKARRNSIELKMMFGGPIPEAFKSVISELYGKEGLLYIVRQKIEPAKLFFADFSLLEVDEDDESVAKRKKAHMTMDCFRKAWMANPKASDGAAGNNVPGVEGRQVLSWRRCTRCASVMEEVLSQRPALQWLVMQQRRCFCSGYWDTLAPGKMTA